MSTRERGTERVRVLQVVTNLKFGGTERHVSNLVRLLDRSRFAVHLACLGRYGEFLAATEPHCESLDEYPIRRLLGPATLRRQLQLARDLRRRRIDVVHTYGFYANVFALPAARLAGVPAVVASVRDRGDHLSPRQRRVHRLACGLAHRVLFNADSVCREWIAAGCAPARTAVIPNGIDIAASTPATARTVRDALGIPDGAPLVTVVSRLNALKGVEFFVEAAAVIAARRPDVRFLVVGDVEPLPSQVAYRAHLDELTARRGLTGRLLFTGFRSDVPQLLAASTVSVSPSLSEALSNSILESMAAGVPVVATAVGGAAEAVLDGVTGRLVPPGDTTSIAGAVMELLDTPALARSFGDAARARARTHFTAARMVRDTEHFYLGLLGLERRPAPQPLQEKTA